MRLLVTGDTPLIRLWADALALLVIRHSFPGARPTVKLHTFNGADYLTVEVGDALDTRTGEPHAANPLLVAQVKLTYFPGAALARVWMAAAWAGLAQHEALELVTWCDRIVLNPHAEPHRETPWNRGLRDGLPLELTPETLVCALAVVMPEEVARAFVELGEKLPEVG